AGIDAGRIGELVRARRELLKGSHRLFAPLHIRIVREFVRRDVCGVHRLAAQDRAAVAGFQFRVRDGEQPVKLEVDKFKGAGLRGASHWRVRVISSGLTGMLVRSSPVAARIAAAIAGPEEIVGGSPTPRRPYGACGSGYSSTSICIGGTSRMVGIR